MKYNYKGKQINIDVVHVVEHDYYEVRVIQDDEVVGTLNFRKNKKNGREAFLNKISVDENQIGKGYGNILIRTFEYVAMNLNLSMVEGKFYPENNRAKPFYIANGYAIEKEEYDTFVFKSLDYEKIKKEIGPHISDYKVLEENNPGM